MALIRARQNITVQRAGRLGLPVIISYSLPDKPDDITVEFATPLEEFISDFDEFSFETSNGSFTANITEWTGYDKYSEGGQHITALTNLIPVFRNVPKFIVSITVQPYRASSDRVLASNDEFNI